MALYVKNDANAVLSEDELQKVNGGTLYWKEEGTVGWLYCDDPEFAGKRYYLRSATLAVYPGTAEELATAIIQRQGETGQSDAEFIHEMLDHGYLTEDVIK